MMKRYETSWRKMAMGKLQQSPKPRITPTHQAPIWVRKNQENKK